MIRLSSAALTAVLAVSGAGGILILRGSSAVAANHTAPFGLRANETVSSCSSNATCLEVRNNGSGIALSGVARQNSGVLGEVRQTDRFLFPRAGVSGIDSSTAATNNNLGIFGTSNTGTGVLGETFQSGTYSQAGVEGLDLSRAPTSSNEGVFGFSENSLGVWGTTNGKFGPGIGVEGDALNAIGVFGYSGAHAGVYAFGESPSNAALVVVNDKGGPLLHAYTYTSGAPREVASLDARGNLVIAGNLQTGGTPHFVSRTSAGGDVLTYGTRTSEPTIDDVGEAQLIGGQAYVQLERTFAATVNLRVPYLVFITPQGDTRGLYVSQKSANGFFVRETGGGRSSLAFDYRIVGRPYASNEPRLPAHVASFQSSSSEIQQPRKMKNFSRPAHPIPH